MNVGNVRQLSLDSIINNSLRLETAIAYHELSLQAIMATQDGHFLVNSYGPGYQREKYILALASQIGCKVRCKEICSVPKYQRNLSAQEVIDQIDLLLQLTEQFYLHPFLKVALVKEGEPLLNQNLPEILERIAQEYEFPIKVSSTFPHHEVSYRNMDALIEFASNYPQTVQLQISLGSTNQEARKKLTRYPTVPFDVIRELGEKWLTSVPHPRKVTLTLSLYEETKCNPLDLVHILPPEYFVIRIRDVLGGEVPFPNRTSLSKKGFIKRKKAFENFKYKVIDGRTGDIEREYNLATGQYLFRDSFQKK